MRATAACFLLFPTTISVTAFAEPPSLLLASNYHAEVDLSRYRMSEKYDGIRALWTGEQLITRSGHRISAPEWFTANWPATPLDGELWIDRGKFERRHDSAVLPGQLAPQVLEAGDCAGHGFHHLWIV